MSDVSVDIEGCRSVAGVEDDLGFLDEIFADIDQAWRKPAREDLVAELAHGLGLALSCRSGPWRDFHVSGRVAAGA